MVCHFVTGQSCLYVSKGDKLSVYRRMWRVACRCWFTADVCTSILARHLPCSWSCARRRHIIKTTPAVACTLTYCWLSLYQRLTTHHSPTSGTSPRTYWSIHELVFILETQARVSTTPNWPYKLYRANLGWLGGQWPCPQKYIVATASTYARKGQVGETA